MSRVYLACLFHLCVLSAGNVFRLLARREICPRTKCLPKKHWGEAPKQNCYSPFGIRSEAKRDARRGLSSWVEAESLEHLSAKYCSLVPPPRSTIATAFSPDGKSLASTHGDHTVKIIDSESGYCLKVLRGHRRTPWVVRFHPKDHEILASGSLDHEVHVWNANTSECIGYRDFYRPIASLAFHAEGELLAVASGHKLYLWNYNGSGENSSPTILLKTRRSLRAVHFHPHAAPLLLTAEVNDLDSSNSSMSRATSLSCLQYPPPSLHMANINSRNLLNVAAELSLVPSFNPYPSSSAIDDIQINARLVEQNDQRAFPVDMYATTSTTHTGLQDRLISSFAYREQNSISGTAVDAMDTSEMQHIEGYHPRGPSDQETPGPGVRPLPSISHTLELPIPIPRQVESSRFGQNGSLPSRQSSPWDLPFLQGWLIGQSQAGIHPRLPVSSHMHPVGYPGIHDVSLTSNSFTCNRVLPSIMSRSVEAESSGLQQQPQLTENRILNSLQRVDSIPILGVIPSELSASLSTTVGAELPCTVKLRLWLHDIKNPCAPLDTDKCRLTIPHAVLCSEMGAHFSPCGRYLAACVACVLPKVDAEPSSVSQLNQDIGADGLSPTRHSSLAHQVLYELRIYSLKESTFGSVLVSRVVRAAHCLTSIQFSPTSEHILLAYGRRHSSLLKSIVMNGEVSLPVYTVLEVVFLKSLSLALWDQVYRVSDLELVSVLPSAQDEVNVACFHPSVGGGLVYGTKEGKLRILQYDGAYRLNSSTSNIFPTAQHT
nr:uncharacterized protein LOC113696147 [Coffea arabica]